MGADQVIGLLGTGLSGRGQSWRAVTRSRPEGLGTECRGGVKGDSDFWLDNGGRWWRDALR